MRKNIQEKQAEIFPIQSGYGFQTVESKKWACEFAVLNRNQQSPPGLSPFFLRLRFSGSLVRRAIP